MSPVPVTVAAILASQANNPVSYGPSAPPNPVVWAVFLIGYCFVCLLVKIVSTPKKKRHLK